MRKWVHIRTRETRKARIEIIPMIDTIFFLLVFFMITSLSMVKMKGMGVNLPQDSTAQQKPPPRAVVTVSASGAWYLNQTRIQPAQLVGDLNKQFAAKPETVIVVNVAKTRAVQTLIDVMDDVNKVRTPSGESAPVMIAAEPVSPRASASAGSKTTTGMP